jgi:hypothetical protein
VFCVSSFASEIKIAVRRLQLQAQKPPARFEVTGKVCAIRVHTQEPCPNEKTLQILFTAFACEGNCRKSRRLHFFFYVFTYFEMPISGGSAKRQWYLFFGTYCMLFFFRKNIFCSTVSGQSLFFRKLFILFAEILLKSRVCLQDTPH